MQPHADRTYEQLSPVVLGKRRLVLWHPSLPGDFCAAVGQSAEASDWGRDASSPTARRLCPGRGPCSLSLFSHRWPGGSGMETVQQNRGNKAAV